MKSTQISPMFMSLTETEEASLCGGENLVVVNGNYHHNVITVKGSVGKPGVKKKTVKSTSYTKVVKITKKGEIPQEKLFNFLSSLLNFDWF